MSTTTPLPALHSVKTGASRPTVTLFCAAGNPQHVVPISAIFSYRGETFAIHVALRGDGTPSKPRRFKVTHIETGFSAGSYSGSSIGETLTGFIELMDPISDARFKAVIAAARAQVAARVAKGATN